MDESRDLAVREEQPLSLTAVREQVNLIQKVMQDVMKEGEHYGVIPGCKKPSLLKPGAEKLNLVFRMAPKYEMITNDLPGGHKEVEVVCSLYAINSGKFLGQGVGSCSTMESKYRYRDMKRLCPVCGLETIIKGKAEYGGGWLCYKKKGGCGEKYGDNDPVIIDQKVGKIAYEDPADYYNTIRKMAKKRAHVDAVLTVTAASDIFTQDIEEMDLGITPPPEQPLKPPQEGPLAPEVVGEQPQEAKMPPRGDKMPSKTETGVMLASEAQQKLIWAKLANKGLDDKVFYKLMGCKVNELAKVQVNNALEKIEKFNPEIKEPDISF